MSYNLKIGICGWGNVATGLFEQLNQSVDNQPYEIVCIGARRDNPKCDPGDIKIHREEVYQRIAQEE